MRSWKNVYNELFEGIVSCFEDYPVNSTLDSQTQALRIDEVEVHEHTGFPFTLTASPGECIPLKLSWETSRFKTGHAVEVHEHTGFPLTLTASPGECIPLKLSWETSRFKTGHAVCLLEYLINLLTCLATDLPSTIAQWSVSTMGDRRSRTTEPAILIELRKTIEWHGENKHSAVQIRSRCTVNATRAMSSMKEPNDILNEIELKIINLQSIPRRLFIINNMDMTKGPFKREANKKQNASEITHSIGPPMCLA
jgi:hypothetical protein